MKLKKKFTKIISIKGNCFEGHAILNALPQYYSTWLVNYTSDGQVIKKEHIAWNQNQCDIRKTFLSNYRHFLDCKNLELGE